jgi:hypothetical protein
MLANDEFPMMMEREAGMKENIPPVSVGFGFYPVKDGRASQQAGRAVYKDVEFVRIAVPGDRNSLYFQPAQDSHRARFPQAYHAFKQRDHTPIVGTPIEHWAPVSRAVALNLKAMHVHTVEDLAVVHDGNIDHIGANGRELREQAKAWLASAERSAETLKLAKDKQALQDQLAAMQAQLVALQDQVGSKAAPKASAEPPAVPTPPEAAEPIEHASADVQAARGTRSRRSRKAA